MKLIGETEQETNSRLSVLANSVGILAIAPWILYASNGLPDYSLHTTAPKIEQMAPDAARIAFADGLTCHLDSAGPTDGTFPNGDGVNQTIVTLRLSFGETDSWKAARTEYDNDNRVLWHDEDVEVTEFMPDYPQQQIGHPTDMIIAHEVDDRNVSGTVATQDLNAGALFEVAIRQDVETGAGGPKSRLRETISRRVCGVFKWVIDHFESDYPPVGHSWSKTLVGAQATDFTKF